MSSNSKTEVIINEKHLDLEFDYELNCIIQTWKGYFSSALFREGVNKTNELFEEKKPVSKFLVDISTSGVIKQEDTNWAATTSIPKAMEHGLLYYAIVLPDNVFTQMSLNNFTKDLNQPTLEVKLFNSFTGAKEWLSSL